MDLTVTIMMLVWSGLWVGYSTLTMLSTSRININCNSFVKDVPAIGVRYVNDSTRSNTYTLICDFNCKTYLDTIEISKLRIALTRLRSSSHRLKIETGRWHKPNTIPLSEGKCLSYHLNAQYIYHTSKTIHKSLLLETHQHNAIHWVT